MKDDGVTADRSDVANAERFADYARGCLRYVSEWRTWIFYDGKRWTREHGGAEVRLAMQSARRQLAGLQDRQREAQDHVAALTSTGATTEALKPAKDRLEYVSGAVKWAITMQSAKSIKAMLSLAVALPAFAVSYRHLDVDPFLFNCDNGTIDLRTGMLRPHSAADMLTKVSPVAFDCRAACPLFDRFLSDAMAGDDELTAFLQRAVGYALTGAIREHVLAFNFGGGANGKSTFLGVCHKMLGDYATAAPRGLLFRARGGERHPTEYASLHGARFVTCSEIEQDQAFDEALVKDLTGGDPITTRRMREDFWTFVPSHKLWIAGNHKPTVRGDDEGIWRRMRIVPWTVRVPDEKKDDKLPEKLAAELPGVLAWAVRGCLEWQKTGLREPPQVMKATQDYRDESDPVTEFVSMYCMLDVAGKVSRKMIRSMYETFCVDNGSKPLDAKSFAHRLRAKGATDTAPITDANGKRVDAWGGIRLLSESERASGLRSLAKCA